MDEQNTPSNSEPLYDVIRNKFNKVSMQDKDGKDTINAAEAVQFDITVGSDVITLSLVDPKKLTVFYDKKALGPDKPNVKSKWDNLVSDLRKFTVSKMLELDLHPTDRPLNNVDKDKLVLQSKSEMAESRFSKWDGSKRTSFQGLEKVKVKVRHHKPVDENIMGSRSRNVSRVFIETAAGERFKFPYPLLAGARAMARHIEEGGNWNDKTGQHILDLSEKVMSIRKFARQARHTGMTEAATPVLLRLSEKLDEYRKKLHLMQGARGYHSYMKTMAETYVEPVEHFDGMFAEVNDDMLKLMPVIERILGERESTTVVTESMKPFFDWINK